MSPIFFEGSCEAHAGFRHERVAQVTIEPVGGHVTFVPNCSSIAEARGDRFDPSAIRPLPDRSP